jgi:hypothetical protein
MNANALMGRKRNPLFKLSLIRVHSRFNGRSQSGYAQSVLRYSIKSRFSSAVRAVP